MRAKIFQRLIIAIFFVLTMSGCEGYAPKATLGSPCEPDRAVGSCRVSLPPGRSSHQQGFGRWAWDIERPQGAPVYAPRAGRARLVRGDSGRGGCDVRLADEANYLTIVGEDGLEVLLLHLERGSLEVRSGQRVERGQRVGRVGRTGWTCGDHLHVQLQRPCERWWCQSVPMAWAVGAVD